MGIKYQQQGAEDALCRLDLEKNALLSTAVRGIGSKVVNPALKGISKGKGALSQGAAKAEQGASNLVGRHFGDSAGKATSSALKGSIGEAARTGKSYATLGGAMEGATGALEAEEGERLKGFARGAARGAATWAPIGMAGGAGKKVFRNTAGKKLHQSAAKKHLQKQGPTEWSPAITDKALAKRQMDRGFGASIKDLAKGTGPAGRRGAATRIGTGVSEFAIEDLPFWLMPATAAKKKTKAQQQQQQPAPDSASHAQQPGQQYSPYAPLMSRPYTRQALSYPQSFYPQQSNYYGQKTGKYASDIGASPSALPVDALQDHPVPPGYAGAAVGSGAASIGGGYLSKALESSGKLPKTRLGTLASVALPSLGSVLGGTAGYSTASKMYPNKKPEELEKLEQIDFDKLMRYYKRKDVDTPQ